MSTSGSSPYGDYEHEDDPIVNELTVPEPKAGFKTTEFWLTAFAVLLGALLSTGAIVEDSQTGKIAGALVIALSTLGYGVSRGLAKLMLMLTLGLVLMLGTAGCADVASSYVDADRATYRAVAPEYLEYVRDDAALDVSEKQLRYDTIETWRLRVGEDVDPFAPAVGTTTSGVQPLGP